VLVSVYKSRCWYRISTTGPAQATIDFYEVWMSMFSRRCQYRISREVYISNLRFHEEGQCRIDEEASAFNSGVSIDIEFYECRFRISQKVSVSNFARGCRNGLLRAMFTLADFTRQILPFLGGGCHSMGFTRRIVHLVYI
jgi:hypothetical protein